MIKYILLNTANFRGKICPMYQCFNTETREITYRAYVVGRNARGKSINLNNFEHKHRSKVAKWRESRASNLG